MNKQILLAAGLLLSTSIAFAEKSQTSAESRGYGLLWEDEFEGASLNSNYWSIVKSGSSAWNNTAYDDPRVLEVSNGTLKLRAIKNPNYSGTLSSVGSIDRNSIWTGACDTQYKVDFKYGRVEIRARMESVPRAWPAIWLMPTYSKHGGNPNSGEIDMVERLNLDQYFYSTIHTEYHWDAPNGKADPERYTTEAATDLDDWAVYAMEWDENKIDFYRNDKMYHTFNKGASAMKSGYLRWPFDEEFYIILSQQIGGGWVDGEANSKGLVLQDSHLPYELEIDYVKVYQKGIAIKENSGNSAVSKTKYTIQYTKAGNVKLSHPGNWKVYDVSGKLLKEGAGDLIPFTDYSSGCYMVKTNWGSVKLSIL